MRYLATSLSALAPYGTWLAEGLASGPAIRARWGSTLDALPADHFGRALIAGYVGQLAAAIALLASVERIVIGGGVMGAGVLVPLVRAAALDYLNGYLAPLNDPERAAGYLCAPALGDDAGVVGALLLAADAAVSTAASDELRRY